MSLSLVSSTQQTYNNLQKIEKAIHGTKICEGHIIERLIYTIARGSGRYDEVSNGKEISMIKKDRKKGDRKKHKVDIFCKNDNPPKIWAHNSKGKSFNNTESPESLFR